MAGHPLSRADAAAGEGILCSRLLTLTAWLEPKYSGILVYTSVLRNPGQWEGRERGGGRLAINCVGVAIQKTNCTLDFRLYRQVSEMVWVPNLVDGRTCEAMKY